MTFEEATKKLEQVFPNTYTEDNRLFSIIIIPLNEKDVIEFISDLRDKKAIPSDVTKYSKDNQYNIRGYDKLRFNL